MRAKINYPVQVYRSADFTEKSFRRIRRKLWFNPAKAHAYLLIRGLESDEEPLFIISSGQLINDIYKGAVLQVVGIAKTYESALELVGTIYQDCLEEQNNLDIVYFLDHLKEYLQKN